MTRIGTCVPAVRFAVRLLSTLALGSACTSRSDDLLERLEEGGEVEAADRRGVDELQRRRRHARRGVGDRRDLLPPNAIWSRSIEAAGGVVARNDVVEELRLSAEIVAKAEALELRAVDEDDLRLDVDLRLAQVDARRVRLELVEVRRNVGDAQAVGERVRRDGAAQRAVRVQLNRRACR